MIKNVKLTGAEMYLQCIFYIIAKGVGLCYGTLTVHISFI